MEYIKMASAVRNKVANKPTTAKKQYTKAEKQSFKNGAKAGAKRAYVKLHKKNGTYKPKKK